MHEVLEQVGGPDDQGLPVRTNEAQGGVVDVLAKYLGLVQHQVDQKFCGVDPLKQPATKEFSGWIHRDTASPTTSIRGAVCISSSIVKM